MHTERNPSASFGVVSATDLTAYLRIDDDALFEAMAMASAAAAEIEGYTGLALITQQIIVTTDVTPANPLSLPVGPVLVGATATVDMIADDGTFTPLVSGFWLEAGRYPSLHFTGDAPDGRIRVTYTAGFGPDYAAVPADLRQAVLAQTAALYDQRGSCGYSRMVNRLQPVTARVAARYRRVAL